MKTKIFCRTRKSYNDFYIVFEGREYFLFSQNRRKGVERYYQNGVALELALKHSRGKTDCAIHRTMDKLRLYIRYIESQNEIAVLNKTKERIQKAAA